MGPSVLDELPQIFCYAVLWERYVIPWYGLAFHLVVWSRIELNIFENSKMERIKCKCEHNLVYILNFFRSMLEKIPKLNSSKGY